MSLLHPRPLLCAFIGAVMVLSGCGIRSSVENAVEEGAEAAQEAAEEAAAEVAEDVAEAAVDEAAESVGDRLQDAADGATEAVAGNDDPLDPAVRADADSLAETTLADGGRIAVAVQCESLQGGNLIFVGLVGVAPGIYDGELVPPAGGGVDVGVTDEGRGLGIRQSRLSEPSYTVSYPTIDGGVSLTVDGCPE